MRSMTALLLPAAAAATAPPNFVILFADDFGWGDLHSYGHPTQERGVIDRLAEKGVRFTQCAESLCTPSRAALLTGRLPTRMGFAHSLHPWLHLPFHRGFDFVGHILPFSNHWACDESGRHEASPDRGWVCLLYHNTTLVQQPIDHTNLTETLAADAAHVSMFTGTRWDNTSANGIFGDQGGGGQQVRAMDWAAGQVVDAVDAA
eukprot:gene3350-13289_t